MSDREQYTLILTEMQNLPPFSPDWAEFWKQLEAVKNRNGGLPPAEMKGKE
jgi:hypothetical protein